MSVPLRIPTNAMLVTGGEVNNVAVPETLLPDCVADHVTRSALPPPDPAPTIPDHVPVRSSDDGAVCVPLLQPMIVTTTTSRNEQRAHTHIDVSRFYSSALRGH